MIKFLQSKISIAFRTRLTRYIHDLYLNDNLNYYKLANLDGGIGQGADQFITQDLTHFCAAAASLYSSLGKPFIDLIVFNYQLYRSLGPLALTGLTSNYFLTATILRRLSPPFGKLKAVEGRKEGDFRGLHARLIANAEEVAFYGGASMEKIFLDKEFKSLKKFMEGIYTLKIRYNILEDFILKYSWSAYGYLLSSLPIFLPAWGGLGGVQELADAAASGGRERGRMKEFITNKRLMLSLADAGGRMMYSIKDLSELAGYTSRVYTLISTLHRVHANAYFPPRGTHPELFSLSDVQGTTQKGFDGVRLENVPIVAPSVFPHGGEELIDSLSMIVHSGEHLLVSQLCDTRTFDANRNRYLVPMAQESLPFLALSQVSGRYTEVSSLARAHQAPTVSCSSRSVRISLSALYATKSSTLTVSLRCVSADAAISNSNACSKMLVLGISLIVKAAGIREKSGRMSFLVARSNAWP